MRLRLKRDKVTEKDPAERTNERETVRAGR